MHHIMISDQLVEEQKVSKQNQEEIALLKGMYL